MQVKSQSQSLTLLRPLEKLRTPITDLFKIKHPVLLAGMNVAAGPKLAAAVSNAGGLGVIGGVGYTPEMLRDQIAELKEHLDDKNAPFGVDLLLPQVGGSARKTKCVFSDSPSSPNSCAFPSFPTSSTQPPLSNLGWWRLSTITCKTLRFLVQPCAR